MRTPFFGAAYQSRSLNLANQTCVNLYPEVVETATGKDIGAFYSCPGLDFLVAVGSGPIRGFYLQGSTLYVVSGVGLYSLTTGYSAALVGYLATVTGPVSIIGNVIGTLNQVVVFDGLNGYLVQNGVFTTLNLPFQGKPVSATYQDTFGLVNVSGTNLWYQSNPGDLSVWAALDYSAADALPDNVVCLVSVHREIWLLKQYDTEIWIDAGNANFSFQRLDGPFLETGCAAAASVVKGGESLFWLSQNPQGQAVAVMTTGGYEFNRISTHFLERVWQSYATTADAIGWTYQQEGHTFYVLTFPTGNATWVYDATESAFAGIPLWHQRASLDLYGNLNRHAGNAFVFFNNVLILGDYQSGNLYAMDMNQPLDNGAQRKWIRSWRALSKPAAGPTRFTSLSIDMQTGGLLTPQGANPQVALRWSDDGGQKWSHPRLSPAGPIGATAQRVKFNALGSTKKQSGLDRIFELSSTDVFSVGLIGAELE